jgi:dTDP-4-amino-4,6-dideoxygalactose transaminase
MSQRYHHDILGFNFRLTDLQAAIGLVQLDKLARNTARRREIARRYDRAFASLPVRTPITPVGRTHVFHQYTLDVGPSRDAIAADLTAAGIGVGIYYPIPVHKQPYVQERGIDADLPITEAAAARSLSLPMYPGLTDAEVDEVVAAMRRALSAHGGIAGMPTIAAASA